jgi:hypothetical protein
VIISINKSYFFFLSIFFLSIFTNFFHWDEAFYIFSSENLRNNAVYENLDNQKIIFRKHYIFLLSKIGAYVHQDSLYYINRIVSLFFTSMTFILMIKFLKLFYFKHKNFFIFSYVLFIFWYCFHPGGISSRVDSLSGFLTLYLLYSYFIILNYRNFNHFHLSVFLNLYFLLWDPGKIFPLVLLSFIFILFFFIKEKNYYLILNFLLSSITVLLIFFGNEENIRSASDLIIYLNQLSNENFNSGKINNIQSYFDNFIKDLSLNGRFNHLKIFFKSTYYLILFLYFYVGCFFIYILKNYTKKDNKIFFVLSYFFYVNFFLFISPNKWLHHFTQPIIILCCIIPFIVNKLFINLRYSLNFFTIPLIFFLIFKFYNYSVNNYYLYKNLKKNNFTISNTNFFYKLNQTDKTINVIKKNKKIKNFTADPIFKYIFNEITFLGTHNIKKLKIPPDLIILQSQPWVSDELKQFEKKFKNNYFLFDKVSFNNYSWNFYLKNGL